MSSSTVREGIHWHSFYFFLWCLYHIGTSSLPFQVTIPYMCNQLNMGAGYLFGGTNGSCGPLFSASMAFAGISCMAVPAWRKEAEDDILEPCKRGDPVSSDERLSVSRCGTETWQSASRHSLFNAEPEEGGYPVDQDHGTRCLTPCSGLPEES